MLNEKRLICTYDQGLAKPLPASPYVLVDRRLLCSCSLPEEIIPPDLQETL